MNYSVSLQINCFLKELHNSFVFLAQTSDHVSSVSHANLDDQIKMENTQYLVHKKMIMLLYFTQRIVVTVPMIATLLPA